MLCLLLKSSDNLPCAPDAKTAITNINKFSSLMIKLQNTHCIYVVLTMCYRIRDNLTLGAIFKKSLISNNPLLTENVVEVGNAKYYQKIKTKPRYKE